MRVDNMTIRKSYIDAGRTRFRNSKKYHHIAIDEIADLLKEADINPAGGLADAFYMGVETGAEIVEEQQAQHKGFTKVS
jgi:hypothetical protein